MHTRWYWHRWASHCLLCMKQNALLIFQQPVIHGICQYYSCTLIYQFSILNVLPFFFVFVFCLFDSISTVINNITENQLGPLVDKSMHNPRKQSLQCVVHITLTVTRHSCTIVYTFSIVYTFFHKTCFRSINMNTFTTLAINLLQFVMCCTCDTLVHWFVSSQCSLLLRIYFRVH